MRKSRPTALAARLLCSFVPSSTKQQISHLVTGSLEMSVQMCLRSTQVQSYLVLIMLYDGTVAGNWQSHSQCIRRAEILTCNDVEKLCLMYGVLCTFSAWMFSNAILRNDSE